MSMLINEIDEATYQETVEPAIKLDANTRMNGAPTLKRYLD